MKKKLISLSTALLLALLSFTGCQKEIKEQTNTDPETESLARGDNGGDKNECRLANFTYSGGEYNYHYNNRGLADEWNITGTGLYRQEYDAKGRLLISKWYDGTELLATIHFFYDRNRVVKEIWYNGNTTEIGDEVFYTYDKKGNNTRMESFMNDYYTIATFTKEGNTASWKFFLGGDPYYEGYVTYNRPYKNPYLAAHGIDHGFPFVNPSYMSDKWWEAGEKLIFFDENGDPVVLFDYDPSKTIWQRGHQNYPLSATYFDLVSETWFPNTFEYENCGGNHDNNNSEITAPPAVMGTKRINPMLLMKYNPSRSIKDRASEIRKHVAEMNRNK